MHICIHIYIFVSIYSLSHAGLLNAHTAPPQLHERADSFKKVANFLWMIREDEILPSEPMQPGS